MLTALNILSSKSTLLYTIILKFKIDRFPRLLLATIHKWFTQYLLIKQALFNSSSPLRNNRFIIKCYITAASDKNKTTARDLLYFFSFLTACKLCRIFYSNFTFSHGIFVRIEVL